MNGEIFSQEIKAEKQNLIQINLLPLPFKSFNVFYERRISNTVTTGVAANYFINNSNFFKYYDSKWFSLTADFNAYFSETFKSFYLNTYLKYRKITDSNIINLDLDSTGIHTPANPRDEIAHYFGAGLTAGIKHMSPSGFTVGMFAGGGYYPVKIITPPAPAYSQGKPSLREDLRLGFLIGWGF